MQTALVITGTAILLDGFDNNASSDAAMESCNPAFATLNISPIECDLSMYNFAVASYNYIYPIYLFINDKFVCDSWLKMYL